MLFQPFNLTISIVTRRNATDAIMISSVAPENIDISLDDSITAITTKVHIRGYNLINMERTLKIAMEFFGLGLLTAGYDDLPMLIDPLAYAMFIEKSAEIYVQHLIDDLNAPEYLRDPMLQELKRNPYFSGEEEIEDPYDGMDSSLDQQKLHGKLRTGIMNILREILDNNKDANPEQLAVAEELVNRIQVLEAKKQAAEYMDNLLEEGDPIKIVLGLIEFMPNEIRNTLDPHIQEEFLDIEALEKKYADNPKDLIDLFIKEVGKAMPNDIQKLFDPFRSAIFNKIDDIEEDRTRYLVGNFKRFQN